MKTYSDEHILENEGCQNDRDDEEEEATDVVSLEKDERTSLNFTSISEDLWFTVRRYCRDRLTDICVATVDERLEDGNPPALCLANEDAEKGVLERAERADKFLAEQHDSHHGEETHDQHPSGTKQSLMKSDKCAKFDQFFLWPHTEWHFMAIKNFD